MADWQWIKFSRQTVCGKLYIVSTYFPTEGSELTRPIRDYPTIVKNTAMFIHRITMQCDNIYRVIVYM